MKIKNFKVGNFVLVIDSRGDPNAKINDVGRITFLNNIQGTLRVKTLRGPEISMFPHRYKKLINSSIVI